MDFRGLNVFTVDTVVADVWIREGHDLSAVTRVGEDFLVAGERGVEHHFADGVTGSADRGAWKDRAVCEGQKSLGQDGQHGFILRLLCAPGSLPSA